jgi:hypothetical protein
LVTKVSAGPAKVRAWLNNPRVVEVLLEAGANPDDGRCIKQAADRRDPSCLELLRARRARVAGTWALGAAVYADASEAVSRLLDALLTETGQTASEAINALADAAAASWLFGRMGVIT